MFSLRKLFGFMTVFCIVVAIFRHPLGFFTGNFDTNVFFCPFGDLIYLTYGNYEFIPFDTTLQSFFTFILGVITSYYVHVLLIDTLLLICRYCLGLNVKLERDWLYIHYYELLYASSTVLMGISPLFIVPMILIWVNT